MSERAINVGAAVDGCDLVGSAAMRCQCLGHKELRRAYHRQWAQRGSTTHGRRADYLKGCRCAACADANKAYVSARRAGLRQCDTKREVAQFVPGQKAPGRPVSDVVIDSRYAPPSDSYWTRLDRDGFSNYCRSQYTRMSASKFAVVAVED